MTNVTTTPTNELTLNTLRRLALMQHLGEDFFILNGKAYAGEEDAAIESYEAAKEDYGTFEDFLDGECEEVEELEEDDYTIDYMVLTDSEADEKWDESLDNYIEECITPEIDKLSEGAGNLSYYITFDEERWKRDARMDGRGHSLSSYDGDENVETVNAPCEDTCEDSTTFYIYRTN